MSLAHYFHWVEFLWAFYITEEALTRHLLSSSFFCISSRGLCEACCFMCMWIYCAISSFPMTVYEERKTKICWKIFCCDHWIEYRTLYTFKLKHWKHAWTWLSMHEAWPLYWQTIQINVTKKEKTINFRYIKLCRFILFGYKVKRNTWKIVIYMLTYWHWWCNWIDDLLSNHILSHQICKAYNRIFET